MKRYYYYANTIRKVTSALMMYFWDLHVIRRDSNGEAIQDITVPLTFGPIGKDYGYRKELEQNKTYYQIRPKITFALAGRQFDADRTKSTQEIRLLYDPWFKENNINEELKNQFWADITPAAYTFNYKVEILCEYMDDYCQIVEQILPWFNPSVYLRIKEFEFSNIERNIQVNLSSINEEMQEVLVTDDEIKIIKGTLNLEAKAWLYKPIRDAVLIDIINMRFHTDNFSYPPEEMALFGTFDHTRTPPAETIITSSIQPRLNQDAKVYLTNRNLQNPPDIDPYDTSEYPEAGNTDTPGNGENNIGGCGNPDCPGCNRITLCPCSGACKPRKFRLKKGRKPNK